jgi:flavin-binding protein dodecin
MVRQASQEDIMPGRVARVTEVIAGSPNNFQEAIKLAFERANKTLRNITGMKIVDMTVMCEAGEIQEYRVRAEVIFVLE